ncbi:MAG TPA: type 1 glutamine amidotransferase [Egibacteraceae bacterium]|nr:type 1 glutamine amidotransferase [Egibacteraceae bacterium]
MKPLIAVRFQENAPLGILAQAFDERRVSWRYVDAWRPAALPDLGDMAGLVVLGGAMNVDDLTKHPYLGPVRELVAAAVAGGVPTLGICLGAQVLTAALGAPVTRAPVCEIGFVQVTATEAARTDPVLAPFAPSARVFQFHEDACALPPGAELLFEGEAIAVQAFRAGPRAYGVQFHFEVTDTEIAAWCDEEGADVLRARWGATKAQLLADARRALPRQQAAGRQVARNFLRLVPS